MINNTPEGIVYLTEYGLIKVSGDDATSFLQGQLTADMDIGSNPELCFASFCNLKGRVVAFFRAIYRQKSYYLCLPKDLIEAIISEFKKYVIIAKVEIEDVSKDYSLVGVLGKESLNKITKITNNKHTDSHLLTQNSKNPIGLWLINKNDNSYESLDINKLTYNDWKLTNIESHIPEIFKDTSGNFLPHNINLPQIKAISFTKGCYRGQEIISRMEYKAKIKKCLKVIECDSFSEFQKNKVLINFAKSETSGYICLIEGDIEE